MHEAGFWVLFNSYFCHSWIRWPGCGFQAKYTVNFFDFKLSSKRFFARMGKADTMGSAVISPAREGRGTWSEKETPIQ